ncbi:MASE1 domain-containing protein [Mariprofundus sp. EBB-1]|uniref:hybrid sensor histidine kinase/response regulator n=1 Tax=Mariprofundus sp. EBB-1 TaxID=2650971 RepID=UPI00137AC95E|nr:MASE1 domain-containing protein [Mariprofundus sp. EBB-1]
MTGTRYFLKRFAIDTIAIAMLYALLGKIGLSVAIPFTNVSAFWPPSGFALAMVLLLGRRSWPGIFLGALIVNTATFFDHSTLDTVAYSIVTGIGIAIGSLIQPILGAKLFHRLIGTKNQIARIQEVLTFALIIPLMCLISSSIGVSSLLLGGVASFDQVAELWLTWWLGDSLGVLIFTPLLLVWWNVKEQQLKALVNLKLLIIYSILIASGFIGFGAFFSESQQHLPLEFIVWPCLLWLALHFTFREVSIGILILSGVSAWQTSHGVGPFILGTPNHSLLMLQLFIFITAITAMIISILVRKSEQRLFEAERLNSDLNKYKETLEYKVEERTKEVATFAAAFEQIGEAIVITDEHGEIKYINPAYTNLTGYTIDEAVGCTPGILKSGHQSQLFYTEMWSVITSGNRWQKRVINKRKDDSFYPALLTVSSIKNKHGIIEKYIGIQQDLSSYESLEDEFHQSQKMESIGTLVGGIAHDFNNCLAGITGNVFLAKEDIAVDSDAYKCLDEIEMVSFRTAELISQMLTFARKDMRTMNPINAPFFLKETANFQKISLPKDIHLVYEIPDGDLQIRGDINLLQQVIMNLLNNARDAVAHKNRPCITIKLETYEADQAFKERHQNMLLDSYCCIIVIDNGSGIDAKDIKQIYDPFFTTKEVGKGTGLGLAMSYGAIQSHGGAIEVESVLGSGTSFKIYLPLLTEAQADAVMISQEAILRGKGETILLVDDEDSVIHAEKGVLESLGYKLVTASNGKEAIEKYQNHNCPVDLTILDVVMPVMGGVEAAREIRKINHHAKIIFSTGYDRTQRFQKGGSMDSEEILLKPFRVARVSQLIRKLLNDNS